MLDNELAHIKNAIERNRVCVIMPTYNNANTVVDIVKRVLVYCENLIVVNDGSTDCTLELVEPIQGIELVSYKQNKGKGYALKQGFIKAVEMGFRYAITLDSDGQHYPEDIPMFIKALEKNPDTLIVGKRGFSHENMNGKSTFANRFSNFWFTVQTARCLADTQTGYRLYPLKRLPKLSSSRYEAELELLVFSAWKGIKMRSIPINVYYPPKEERVSHFRPTRDFIRISILNTILCFLAVIYGYPMMAYWGIRNSLYNWVTTKKGVQRDVPLTFKRVLRSVFAITFFATGMFLLVFPGTVLYFLFGKRTDKKRMNYHRFLRRASEWIINHVPSTDYRFENKSGETFEKPAVIISNHQGHLDLMCILMMSPHIVVLTNDWVWKNPLYGFVLRYGEFYPVSDGLEANLSRLKNLIERGYSVVIFPEGTRSEDCSILRFHSGAFYLAQQLGVDIVPLFLHGVGHVIPKKDFMLREGSMYAEIQQRIPNEDLTQGDTLRKITRKVHDYYLLHYNQLRDELETSHYHAPYVRYKYLYKGWGVGRKCRKLLKKHNNYTAIVDKDYSSYSKIIIENCGRGELAWLMALVHRKKDVYAFEQDFDLLDIATSCSNIPVNLHFMPMKYINDYCEANANIKHIILDDGNIVTA